MKSLAALAVAAALSTGDSPFHATTQPALAQGYDDRALYVPLKDGTRIAIDVLTPKGAAAGARFPAMLKIARFGRADPQGRPDRDDRFWTAHGYVRVLIDERGVGASFGVSRFGAATVSDLAELADWIAAQPWSNGRIGAVGISVEGTAAELLAATGRPSVRAVAPLFSDYDYYADLVRPGGVHDIWLTRNFGGFTKVADAGAAAKRVDADPQGALAAQAIAQHKANIDLDAATVGRPFADDRLDPAGGSLESLSVSAVKDRLAAARVPQMDYASWLDAGTAQGTLRRFRDLPNPQTVVIGAWSHAGNSDADPFRHPGDKPTPSWLQRQFELLQFFDAYLKPSGAAPPPRKLIWYYTLGEGRWRATPRWPPSGVSEQRWGLSDETLTPSPAALGERRLALSETDTGERNRWRTQFGGQPVDYSKVARALAALPGYVTTPLIAPLTFTGTPILRLRLRIDTPDDPSLFAYLLALAPDGHTVYLTEGQLRLADRKPSSGPATRHSYRRADFAPVPAGQPFAAEMTLIPTSAQIPAGWRLRLGFASGDAANFATTGPYAATLLSGSSLALPVRAAD